ncbi:activating signal cointegrator 1 complex subunit 2 [Metarhizium album ARSEF 1941]|uniref:Activating signal cointegrator 1 complex subunit 2 n=1 Tax=Metarhizium album (strain ARSEF 1941) TaxID=1081103 RepID=A0A0B2WUJ7_METAS|nr:activating signal cointegrator 1 complex subunit 2 [Metarhizium album ARSEF 1941]KHN97172.1 activating signal cointegrator 1 complex subunit 2 [Metarhizium album ARSEF 1941]
MHLPPLAAFPEASWQQQLAPREWESLVQAWAVLCRAYLRLSDDDFRKQTQSRASLVAFSSTFVRHVVAAPELQTTSASLLRPVFHLTSRLLRLLAPPDLLEYSFLAGFARIYPKKRTSRLIAAVFGTPSSSLHIEASLTTLKKQLIPILDAGIKGDVRLVEARLVSLGPLLHASPHACVHLLAGSDFLQGLVTCFKVTNPPLRRAIVTTTYLCVVGLTEAEPPKWSMLSDQLFALRTVAEAHRMGPLNANDSLVAELVTATPLLKVLLRRAEERGVATESLKKRIALLESFGKGPMARPERRARSTADKEDVRAEMRLQRVSQIARVQDLFPDLGAGFVSRCLDEYNDDAELVVANLLSESLPHHLATAHRSEPLCPSKGPPLPDPAPPRPTCPHFPTRRNVFDDDEFDRLGADESKISFGKKPRKDADELLRDRSAAPNKAAVLSALASFDSDDDERDDTYDAADVGGTVDSMDQEADGAHDGSEEVLFRAYQSDESVFGRDVATRRSGVRAKMREETGMTDEAIEGWAVMLARNPQQKRRLDAKYAFAGQQAQLERTAWRAGPAGSATEDGDVDGGARRGDGGRGRGRGGRGRGRGGRGGSVGRATGEKETEAARSSKEAHKGSRANHNRRDARARKMARGGFAG